MSATVLIIMQIYNNLCNLYSRVQSLKLKRQLSLVTSLNIHKCPRLGKISEKKDVSLYLPRGKYSYANIPNH